MKQLISMKTLLFFCTFLLAVLSSCYKKTADENGIGLSKNGNCWCTDYMVKELKLSSHPDAYKWSVTTLSPAGQFSLGDRHTQLLG